MTDTFNFVPLIGVKGQGKFRVRTAQFGDGYSQAVEDGLNTEVQSWPLTFIGNASVINPVLAFLRAHPGAISFNWTPPLGTQGLYRCGAYTLKPEGNGVYTLECQLDQVFSP